MLRDPLKMRRNGVEFGIGAYPPAPPQPLLTYTSTIDILDVVLWKVQQERYHALQGRIVMTGTGAQIGVLHLAEVVRPGLSSLHSSPVVPTLRPIP